MNQPYISKKQNSNFNNTHTMTFISIGFLLILNASSLLGYPKHAMPKQSNDNSSPTGTIEACMKNYNSLIKEGKCAKEAHNQTELDCLLSNESMLSDLCRKAISEKKEKWNQRKESFQKLKKACETEIKKLSIQDQPHKASIVGLMSYDEKLTDNCKSALNTHIKNHLPGIRTLD